MIAPYMPLFVADYLADTAHLSAAEHGAYLLLLMNYWQRQKPLPSDDRKLARIARMTDAEWQDARDTLAELFREADGLWHHKRVDAELARLGELSAKAAAAGKASGEARRAKAEARSNVNERPFNYRSTNDEPSGKARQEKEEDAVVDARASASASLADRCLAAAGLSADPKAVMWPIYPIANCIRGGASEELDVLPTLRRFAGKRFNSWAYVCQAIMDAKAAREAPAPVGRATGPPGEKPMNARQKLSLLANSLGNSDDATSRQHQANRPPSALLAAS